MACRRAGDTAASAVLPHHRLRGGPPMLPSGSLPMPAQWRGLLEQPSPVFARRSTHRLFMALACGLILADRGTVTGMAAAAGIGRQWRRACWFFASAKWDADALGLAGARRVGEDLPQGGDPVVVAG